MGSAGRVLNNQITRSVGAWGRPPWQGFLGWRQNSVGLKVQRSGWRRGLLRHQVRGNGVWTGAVVMGMDRRDRFHSYLDLESMTLEDEMRWPSQSKDINHDLICGVPFQGVMACVCAQSTETFSHFCSLVWIKYVAFKDPIWKKKENPIFGWIKSVSSFPKIITILLS